MKQTLFWAKLFIFGYLVLSIPLVAVGQNQSPLPFGGQPGLAIGKEDRLDQVDKVRFFRSASVVEWVTSGYRWFVFS